MNETRKLVFDTTQAGIPEDLDRYPLLEDLEIDLTRYPKDIEALAKVPLRRLKIGFVDESRAIPTPLLQDLIALPLLEELSLGFTRLPRGCKSAFLAPLVKGLAATKATPETRRLQARLLLGAVAEILESDVEVAALLEALDCKVAPVRSTALSVLSKRVAPSEIGAGAEVVLVGALNLDRAVVAERLSARGATLVKKASKQTTHVLVGDKPAGKWRPLLEGGALLVLEEHLPKEGFLVEEAKNDAATSERLAELLSSEDSANIGLAVEMMKSGGVPGGVFEELFLAYQRSSVEKKVREGAKKLFFAHAPLELRTAVEKHLRGTSIYFSGDTKTKSRIKTLAKESKGKLDGTKLALLVGCVKYIFDEVRDAEVQLRCLEARRSSDGTLDLLGKELSSLPAAVGRVPGVTKLELGANHFTEIPSPVFELTSLRALSIGHNQLEDLSPSLAKLPFLESLAASVNRFAKLPSVVPSLGKLKVLHLSTERYGMFCPWSVLPDAIGELSNLEELALEAHTFGELPRSLTKLEKLQRLDLSHVKIPSLPAWLAELPSLTEIDLRWMQTDVASLEDVVKRLADRNVVVQR